MTRIYHLTPEGLAKKLENLRKLHADPEFAKAHAERGTQNTEAKNEPETHHLLAAATPSLAQAAQAGAHRPAEHWRRDFAVPHLLALWRVPAR